VSARRRAQPCPLCYQPARPAGPARLAPPCCRADTGCCGGLLPVCRAHSPRLMVSPFLAWIGSPCLRHCVHGASIGGRGARPRAARVRALRAGEAHRQGVRREAAQPSVATANPAAAAALSQTPPAAASSVGPQLLLPAARCPLPAALPCARCVACRAIVACCLPTLLLLPARPARPPSTGAGGDHGIAKLQKRRAISVGSYYDPSHDLPPHP
jgi:hypothetical protein